MIEEIKGGMMQHKIGVHYIPMHGRQTDLDYMATLRPPSIKIVGLDVQRIADVHSAAPNALLVFRQHKLSEEKQEQETAPAETGTRHGRQWADLISALRSEARRRGLRFPDNNQICILGINEPNLEAPAVKDLIERKRIMRNYARACDAYTERFLQEANRLGFVGGALNLSNGGPTNWDFADDPHPGAAPDWDLFPSTYAALIRHKGILFLHEYWTDAGPSEGWGWYAGRYQKCPWNVPIIIGECGIDMIIKRAVPDQSRGWQSYINTQTYMGHWRYYHDKALEDPRIHSIQPYTTDYGSPWQTFDMAPVQPSLVAYAREVEARPGKPSGWVGYVTAPDGLNLRAGASTGSGIITTVPYGQAVTVWGQDADWYLVTYGTQNGYMHTDWIGKQAPASGLFDRSFSLVIGTEGLYSNDPDDPGNWTGGSKGAGELKGTKYGISAAAYPNLDIVNLTTDQAKQIYLRDYWVTSGASNLEWPLCYLQFDTAVQHGVSAARSWLTASGGKVTEYVALRLSSYANSVNWPKYGAGWTNRIIKILRQF